MNFWDKVEGTQEFSSLKLYHYVCSDGAPPFFCAHSLEHHSMSGQCQLSQKGMCSKIRLSNSQHNVGPLEAT